VGDPPRHATTLYPQKLALNFVGKWRSLSRYSRLRTKGHRVCLVCIQPRSTHEVNHLVRPGGVNAVPQLPRMRCRVLLMANVNKLGTVGRTLHSRQFRIFQFLKYNECFEHDFTHMAFPVGTRQLVIGQSETLLK
jgi:hypothetical protein